MTESKKFKKRIIFNYLGISIDDKFDEQKWTQVGMINGFQHPRLIIIFAVLSCLCYYINFNT